MLFFIVLVNLLITVKVSENKVNSIGMSNVHSGNNTDRNTIKKRLLEEYCANNPKDNFTDLHDNTIVKEEFCKNKSCITKCCLENHVYLVGRCTPTSIVRKFTNNTLDYSDFDIYEANIRILKKKSTKNLSKDYTFIRNLKVLKCGTRPARKPVNKYLLLEVSHFIIL